jgi:hypothetical protein
MTTINNDIPFVPEGTIDPAAGLNLSLNHIDAILQVAVIAIQDSPPGSPAEGDRYIIGAGTGDWAGHDNEVARYLDGVWTFHDTVVFALNLDDEKLYLNTFGSSGWVAVSTASSVTYNVSFDDGDLDTSDVLSVVHNLGRKWVHVTVYKDNKIIEPGEVTAVDTTTVNIDMADFVPLLGSTYHVVVG